MPPLRRKLLMVLAVVTFLAMLFVAGVQVTGGPIGAPCVDSYSCKGFLIAGAECVAVDEGAYCTRYCDKDAECPQGWSCQGAHPTVLTLRTTAVDEVCVRAPESPLSGEPATR